MSWFSRRRVEGGPGPILRIDRLNVYYGRAHAVQDVSLTLDRGVLAVVGRNGMGKTTLCNAVTGLVAASGSIKLTGAELVGLAPHAITGLGVGYVPQGRRLFPSLSVDEHLRIVEGRRNGARRWTPDRVYELFPRLAERKRNGGAQLSGGEQQMLAIGRALLTNPDLLIMDEPSEGLAPTVIEALTATFKKLEEEGLRILLIEQNLAVATSLAERQLIMIAGEIAAETTAGELAANPDLQRRYLGVEPVEHK
jgi:ABC-type branched-subunit amino acid transport system ATPase component